MAKLLGHDIVTTDELTALTDPITKRLDKIERAAYQTFALVFGTGLVTGAFIILALVLSLGIDRIVPH